MSLRTTLVISCILIAGCWTPETDMKKESHASALHPAEMVGFLVTSDVARCRAYFVDRLGFREIGEDPFALVLEADGRMIRIQKARKYEPRAHTVLGWNVTDIEASRDRLADAGVSFEHFGLPGQDPRGIMTFSDGARVAWFKDPDGNILSIAQLP